MKLPIANLNKVKLLGHGLQRNSRNLSPEAGLVRPRKLAHTKNEKLKNEKTKHEPGAYRIVLLLLLVRPWILVLGLWISSMGLGTLALGGMLRPGRLTKGLPETAPADIAGSTTERNTGLFPPTAATNKQLSLTLPFVLLISSCVVGCFLISRRRAMKMAAARSRVRKVHGGLRSGSKTSAPTRRRISANKVSAGRSAASRSTASKSDSRVGIATGYPVRKAPIRTSTNAEPTPTTRATAKTAADVSLPTFRSLAAELRSKQRSRSKTGQAARTAAGSNRRSKKVLVSRATVARSNTQSRQSQPGVRKSTRRAVSRRRQPVVSVVPASEAHPLDWNETSLAHQMDVRHRSAM